MTIPHAETLEQVADRLGVSSEVLAELLTKWTDVNPPTKWGPGDTFEPFETVVVNGKELELGRGEGRHSESSNDYYVRHPWGIIDFDGHRRPVRVEIEEYNYMKESEHSGDEVRKMCRSTIWINGCVARTNDGPRTVQAHLRLIERQIADLSDGGPSVWNDGEALVGRKIYYGRIPAVIERINTENAELYIVPTEDLVFDPSPYAVEDDLKADEIGGMPPNYHTQMWLDDYGHGMMVKDNDQNIWWWRK